MVSYVSLRTAIKITVLVIRLPEEIGSSNIISRDIKTVFKTTFGS